MSNVIVGLDIGTCFIRSVIAEINSDNKIEIIGVSKRPSQGLRNGVIVNIDAAVAAIKETVEAAEQSAGMEVTSVFTVIGGSQVESLNTTGQVGVDVSEKKRSLEITESAKNRAIENSKAVRIPLDKKLIHVIPQEYIIDGVPGYKNPIGMMGVRLEVKAHLVEASITAYSTIQQCVTRAGYMLDGLTLKTLAASFAALHEDEMELGSVLIDLGGGSTDVIVLNKGSPVYTASIPVGGNFVTKDISLVKGISTTDAEKIKVESGCCWISGTEQDEEVIIPSVGGRAPELTTRYELCQIIQPRMGEIFSMVKKNIVKNAPIKLNGSIVLTGGGALMPGVVELAQSVFRTSAVRLGESSDFGGVDDSYRDADFATVMGLVIAHNKIPEKEKVYHKEKKGDGSKTSGLSSFKNFLGKFF